MLSVIQERENNCNIKYIKIYINKYIVFFEVYVFIHIQTF